MSSQTNPLWHEQKTKNYLPHMTWPEVRDLLVRTDMAIFPVTALEQHGLHGPMGTDFYNGVERAKLIAQKTDVLVAPVLIAGNSPYHMEFPGTITLSMDVIQQVFFEAATSLMRHGFKRFLILNSHGGNLATSRYIVDRINQETTGIAVELREAAQTMRTPPARNSDASKAPPIFDKHGGVGETSRSLYLTPTIVDMAAARTATLTMPEHLEKMMPEVLAGDPVATRVFMAEGLKAKETGKQTSAREMSSTGTWGVQDLTHASAERGRRETENFVDSAVRFIERWKQLRPMKQ